MAYTEIKNFPSEEDVRKLESPELEALGKLWKEKKGKLESSGEYQEFLEKMQREWAIETGIIERLYMVDRGITETLIEQGIDASIISSSSGINRDQAESMSKLMYDQKQVIEGLFAFVKDQQPLTEHYIREMHALFTKHQDYTEAVDPSGNLIKISLLKGEYKRHDNNPKRDDRIVHEYCPPLKVKDEMERLITIYQAWQDRSPSEVLSAWLHHRFTQIHPFQDGNGRIARSLASLIFLRDGLFPLVIRNTDRNEYITALEKADDGNIQPLVRLFTNRQRHSILSALGIQQQVEQTKHANQIISNVAEMLKAKAKNQREQILELHNTAKELHQTTLTELNKIKDDLNKKLNPINAHDGLKQYCASSHDARDTDEQSYYFHRQIIAMARIHDYYADLDGYKSWTKLTIQAEKIFEIVFSIHGHGYRENGVMVVSGFTHERVSSENGMESTEPKPCHMDLFQFNHIELKQSTKKRFSEWIAEAITFALADWQKTIAPPSPQ